MEKICDICGINFKVEEVEDNGLLGYSIGMSQYSKQLISILKNIPIELKEQTLIHEWLHMELTMNGFIKESENENLVSVLSNELYRKGFRIKLELKGSN